MTEIAFALHAAWPVRIRNVCGPVLQVTAIVAGKISKSKRRYGPFLSVLNEIVGKLRIP